MAKRLDVQFKSQMIDESNLLAILSFVLAFQMEFDTNGIPKGAAMWLFHVFMKELVGAALSAGRCLASSRWSHKEGKLTSYFQVSSYFVNTYATDDIIVEADVDNINYRQLQDVNDVDYSQSPWTKVLSCGSVYEEYPLNGTFIRDLRSSILQTVRSYWVKNKGVSVQRLT